MNFEHCRTWGKRRILYTREVIILTSTEAEKSNCTKNFDAIPMFQIESIREMEQNSEAWPKSCRAKGNENDSQGAENFHSNESGSETRGRDRTFGRNPMIEHSKFIEIKTSKDGVNLGRSYCLKVSDPQMLTYVCLKHVVAIHIAPVVLAQAY
jgi:hypothetical protein